MTSHNELCTKKQLGWSSAYTKCTTGILIGDSKNIDWTGRFDTKRYPSRTKQDVPPFDNILLENTITETVKQVVHNEN